MFQRMLLIWTGIAALTGALVRAALPSTQPAGVAVVELFTSQGCSSCPPAEAELARINATADQDHTPIFTLAFHVDYWDHGGWRDPFSRAAFSAQQYGYARLLHLNDVYTPQMIVNGQTEFTGSDADKADRAIAAALATPAAVPLTISTIARQSDGMCKLTYAAPAITAVAGDLLLNAALVEQGLSTHVRAGENAGRVLDQPSVVRWFHSTTAASGGAVTIPALAGIRPERCTVVVYVQRKGDGAVLGAASVPLPTPR